MLNICANAAKGLKTLSRPKFSDFGSHLDIKVRVAIDAESDLGIERLALEECGIVVDKLDKHFGKPM
jgi:hypothetical protein